MNNKFFFIKLQSVIPFISLFSFAVICSCSTTPTVVEGDIIGSAISSKTEVLLLPPTIKFEHVANGKLTPEQRSGVNEIEEWIHGIAEEEIGRKGLSLHFAKKGLAEVGQQENTTDNNEYLCKKLVLSNIKPSTARDLMQDLCGESTNSAVLAHTLRVKIGQERSTDLVGLPPLYLGVVQRVGMCSSYLRVAIRDCATGKILWANSVLFRDLPRMENPDFENAIRQLYSELSTKGE